MYVLEDYTLVYFTSFCKGAFNSSANYIEAYLISQAVVPLPNCFYLFMKGSSIIVVEDHTTWVTWALIWFATF